eukprot:498574-Prymnesium_polylepis.1
MQRGHRRLDPGAGCCESGNKRVPCSKLHPHAAPSRTVSPPIAPRAIKPPQNPIFEPSKSTAARAGRVPSPRGQPVGSSGPRVPHAPLPRPSHAMPRSGDET